jgi:polysaccharide pyruvyl transferase WcaK-like protein
LLARRRPCRGIRGDPPMIHHVFANKSNLGDWLSARGIQSLLAPFEVREHLCDEPFVPETIRRLSDAGEEDFVIIGGGGLFMDYFIPFWNGLSAIADRTRYAIWGVGYCDMKRTMSRAPAALINSLVDRSRLCVVRDELTRRYLRRPDLPAAVACPTMAAIDAPAHPGRGLLHVDAYDNIGPAAYEAMGAELKEFARRTGRPYRQTNNLIPAGHEGRLRQVLELYEEADLVVSSRLHGCIIAIAMGRKILAVSGDRKVESFMEAAGLGDWVIDSGEIARMPRMLPDLEQQKPVPSMVDRTRRENREVAARVRALAGLRRGVVAEGPER